MSAELLSQFVGSHFRIYPDAAPPVDVELTEVELLQCRSARPGHLPRGQAFAAIFQLREARALEQQTCRVAHAQLGAFDLFLGAVPGPCGQCRLEAIFN